MEGTVVHPYLKLPGKKKWKGENTLLIILMKIFLKLRGRFLHSVPQEDIAAESLAKANLVQGGVRVVKRSHHSGSSLMQVGDQ